MNAQAAENGIAAHKSSPNNPNKRGCFFQAAPPLAGSLKPQKLI